MSDTREAPDELVREVIEVLSRHVPGGLETAAEGPEAAALAPVGLDSLKVVELLLDLESTFGISFPADMLDRETFRDAGTIAAAVARIRATA